MRPSASASRALRGRTARPPERQQRLVRPASDSRSSRLCSRTRSSGLRIARAEELEVPGRNLEARDVAGPARAEDLRSRTVSEQPTALAPETPRRDAARPRAAAAGRPGEPVEQIPRLEQRRVERLAVEADERAGRPELARRPRRASQRSSPARSAGAAARRTRRRRNARRSPTRNAYVPAPPLSPVVSRSKNTNGAAARALHRSAARHSTASPGASGEIADVPRP